MNCATTLSEDQNFAKIFQHKADNDALIQPEAVAELYWQLHHQVYFKALNNLDFWNFEFGLFYFIAGSSELSHYFIFIRTDVFGLMKLTSDLGWRNGDQLLVHWLILYN